MAKKTYKNNKIKKLTVAVQASLLRRVFPTSKITNFRDKELIWQHIIKPSPLSAEYAVKLHYKMGDRPHVYILEPKPLTLAKSAKRLPHVYDQAKQRLCLYYPDGKQWNSTMPLVETVIWWTFEWLYHYELWLGTDDDWKGGGIHPFVNQTKIEDTIKSNK
ncbi:MULTISPECIES: hypothetical protein [unclassified Chryseobacterium]|uniref:hypothetical protein n=1 Tax=unclassified Chryseobacterium TaxID=2593645 RepID=UPI001E410A72|nr:MULTISPECIES: hypothetical protein [unclassified Chryseobacterium]